jgi:hypothetical protein
MQSSFLAPVTSTMAQLSALLLQEKNVVAACLVQVNAAIRSSASNPGESRIRLGQEQLGFWNRQNAYCHAMLKRLARSIAINVTKFLIGVFTETKPSGPYNWLLVLGVATTYLSSCYSSSTEVEACIVHEVLLH